MKYKHTQKWTLIVWVLGFIAILYLALFIQWYQYEVATIMIIIFLVLLMFSCLTVIIKGKYLKLKFWLWVFSKKFLLSDIKSVKKVKNYWYYGWGIRVWFWPYMWIYNISWFDGVEIKLKNKKIYRIGTNKPKELEKAIKDNMG